MNKATIEKLVKIADKLDQKGKFELSDLIDKTIQCLTTKTAGEIEDLIKQIEQEPFEPKPKPECKCNLPGCAECNPDTHRDEPLASLPDEEPTDQEIEQLWENDK